MKSPHSLLSAFHPKRSPVLWLLTAALTACNPGGGTPPSSNTAPEVSVKTIKGTAITSDTYIASAGQVLVTASDLDGSIQKVTYSIDGGASTDITPSSRMILTLPSLSGGVHSATVTATDNSGAATTANFAFKVDSAAPVIESATLNGSAINSTTSLTVGDAATLVVRASDTRGDTAGTPGSVSVRILEGGTVRATGSGTVSADLSKTADGTVRTAGTVVVTVEAEDSVGYVVRRTLSLNFNAADTSGGGTTTAPTLTWLNPVSDFIKGNSTVMLRATATRNGQDVTGSITYSATCGTVTGNSWALGNDCTDGSKQTLTATVTDGGKQYSTTRVVTIDASLPTAQITSPTNNQNFTSAPIKVDVQAQDTGSGIATVRIYARPAVGTEQLIGTLSASGSLAWYPEKTDSTAYTLRAEITDQAGNSSTSSLVSGIRLQTASSITAPAVTVSVPAAPPQGLKVNQGGRDYVRGYLDVRTTASTTAANGFRSAELLVDNAVVATDVTGTGTSSISPTFTYDFDKLNDGLHDVAIRLTDNVGTVTAPKVSVFVDKTAPVVTWNAPVDGTVTNVASLALNATAQDAAFGAITPTFTANGAAVTSPWTAPEGQHRLVAFGVDPLGNRAQSSITVTVDRSGPDINVSSPSTNQEFTTAPIALSATATDRFSTVVRMGARIINPDGTTLSLGQQNGSSYTTPFTPSVPGTYSVIFTATDSAGNIQETPGRSFILRDAVAPTVILSSPIDGQLIEGNTFTLSATANDNVSVQSVTFYAGGEQLEGVRGSGGSFTAAWNTSTLRNGTSRVYAVAVDGAGNRTTSQTVTVTVARKPTVAITAPSSSTTPLNGFINVNIEATDNNGVTQVELFANNTRVGTLTSPPYNFALNTASYSNGQVELFARATNTTGQIQDSAKVNIQVRNQVAPALAISAPSNGSTVTTPSMPVQLTLTRRNSSFDIQPMTYAPDPSVPSITVTEDVIRVDLIDYRGALVSSRYIKANDNTDGVYSTPSFDLAGLPADIYTIRAKMIVTLDGGTVPQTIEQAIQFTTRNQSSNPPAAVIRVPVQLTPTPNAAGAPLPILNRDSAILTQVSDDTGLRYVQVRFINEDGTPTNAYLLNETLASQPGPFDRLVPTIEIDGSQYIADDRNYFLRITTEDVDGNRNVQEVKVRVDRDQRLADYSQNAGAFNDARSLASGQLTHQSATWGLGCGALTNTDGSQALTSCANLTSNSRVVAVVYRDGVIIDTDVRPQIRGPQVISYGFTVAGTYRVDWIVQDLSSGVVQRYRGESKSVTRNE